MEQKGRSFYKKKQKDIDFKKYLKPLIIVAVIVFGVYYFTKDNSVYLGPGVFAPDEPLQTNLETPETFRFKNYNITLLAQFSIKAKVLSKENYKHGRESDLSPTDLALGWGRMSDEAVLKNIKISQSGRWYRWRVKEFPIPKREIETHSANMHIIPATGGVEDILKRVKKGQIIEIEGYLVNINGDDGWSWHSSLTRNDTGNHACEVVYVENLLIVKGI